MGVINKLLGRLKLYSDPAVTTQTTTVIQSDTTNSNLALVPNGTGAIIASVPDGTATGGNARGQYAVDLQRGRVNSNQVSSGTESFIGNGEENRVTGIRSSILNGIANQVTLNESSIVGGRLNTISNEFSFLGGGVSNNISSGYSNIAGGNGNNVSSSYSTISGGQSNTASTNTHATVVGGQSNTSSGPHSVSGGFSCIASGAQSTAFGSRSQATNLGTFSVGEQCYATSELSSVFGTRGKSYLYGQQVLSSMNYANGNYGPYYGIGQSSILNAWRFQIALTTGATTTLSLDGSGTTNLIIPDGNNRAWNVQIDTIAVVTAITGTATGVSVGDCYRETKQLLFKRIGGTSSIVGTVDTTAVKSDTSMSTSSLTVTAGASQEMALTFTAPTFSGGGSVTVRVVSKVMLVEVAY